MTTYATSPHTRAFLTLIRAGWDLVGDAAAPDGLEVDSQKRLVRPYAVVYGQGGGALDGTLVDPQGDAWPTWQVTYIGRDRDQAESLRDRCRASVLGQTVTVAGRQVGPVRLEQDLPNQRDDDVTPHLFYAIDLYRAYSTPTS